MFTATFRGMVAHKLRLVLTTASIALGVAFLAGTLVLTDTMGARLRPALRQGLRRHRRRRPHRGRRTTESEGVGTSRGTDRRRGPRPRSRHVDGVRAAEGASPATPCSPTTTARPSSPRVAPRPWATACPPTRRLRGDVDLLTGHAPRGAARGRHRRHPRRGAPHRARLARSRCCSSGPTQEFTVVGTVGFGGEKDLGGTTSAYFDTATAQQVLGTPGTFDAIDVRAADGVSQAELAKRLDAVVPDGRRGGDRRAPSPRRTSDAIKRGPQDRRDPVHRSSPASRCSSAPSSSGTRSR